MTKLHSRLLEISHEVGGPLLAIDTSTSRAAVCTVSWRANEVEDLDLAAASQPSELLAEALAGAVAQAHLDVATLRAIVVGIGPGSYTGLRVGLAIAKGLAFGAGIPLYGVSSLAMLAASCGPGPVAAVLVSRVNEVFAGAYEVSEGGLVESLIADDAFVPANFMAKLSALENNSLRLVGGGASACAATHPMPGVMVEPEPRLLAGYGILHAAERIAAGAADDLCAVAPLYLRVS